MTNLFPINTVAPSSNRSLQKAPRFASNSHQSLVKQLEELQQQEWRDCYQVWGTKLYELEKDTLEKPVLTLGKVSINGQSLLRILQELRDKQIKQYKSEFSFRKLFNKLLPLTKPNLNYVPIGEVTQRFATTTENQIKDLLDLEDFSLELRPTPKENVDIVRKLILKLLKLQYLKPQHKIKLFGPNALTGQLLDSEPVALTPKGESVAARYPNL